jgi:hypothetical protein
MQEEAVKYPQVAYYLPDAKELAKVPRQWLANVFYSVAGKPFADWVDAQIEMRNSKIVASDNKFISMDAEIYAAFQASGQVSSTSKKLLIFVLTLWSLAVNGRGVDMLKAGTKRRRTKAELEAFKLEEQ